MDSVCGMSRDGVCVSPFTDQVWCPLRASEDGEEGPSMRDEWPEKETDPSSPQVTEVKNSLKSTFTSLCVCMVLCLNTGISLPYL